MYVGATKKKTIPQFEVIQFGKMCATNFVSRATEAKKEEKQQQMYTSTFAEYFGHTRAHRMSPFPKGHSQFYGIVQHIHVMSTD